MIPWAWIVDETREAERVPSWDSPEQILEATQRQYRKDRWALQPQRVEVVAHRRQRAAHGALLAPHDYGVTFRVMHGYASATAIHEIAAEHAWPAPPLIALYAGDWDPSGLHMSEVDLPPRLREYFFAGCEYLDGGEAPLALRRVALTEEDVGDPDLPSFDAETKRGDTRWPWFRGRYGAQCWELDALSPVVLRRRVTDAIEAEIEWDAWARCARAERAEKDSLASVLTAWRESISGQASE